MSVTPVREEMFSRINRESFRSWRMLDETGAGYLLDPANSGYSYTSSNIPWAQFAIAITSNNAYEQYASHNRSNTGDADCRDSLDDFVNSESIENAKPVLWYSQSRLLDPSVEDWPVISEISLGFDLLPFDWTATSPFEVIE